MKYPSLVIFDMDGLMFDTESIAYIAWKITSKKYGFEMDKATVDQFRGRTNEDILNGMAVIYGNDAPILEWRQYMKQIKNTLIHENIYQEGFKKKGLDSLLENQIQRYFVKLAVKRIS